MLNKETVKRIKTWEIESVKWVSVGNWELKLLLSEVSIGFIMLLEESFGFNCKVWLWWSANKIWDEDSNWGTCWLLLEGNICQKTEQYRHTRLVKK